MSALEAPGAAARAQLRLAACLVDRGLDHPAAMGWDDYRALVAAVEAGLAGTRALEAFTYRHHPQGGGAPVPVRTAYTLWPGPAQGTLVCAGGIANTAHRFDFLGAELGGRFRVAGLDWAGRGRSGWLPEVGDYGFELYVAQLEALIEELAAGPVAVLGSSIGGSAALCLAARRPELIGALVLNDSGAFLPHEHRRRRALAVGRHYVFQRPLDMFRRTGAAQKNDGPVEDAVLLHNGFHQTRWSEADGGRVYRHDPRAMLAYRAMARHDLDLWAAWAGVRCPVLILHGLQSDALSVETLDRMASVRGFTRMEIPATGHTPALSCAHQLALIGAWLEDPAALGPWLSCPTSTKATRLLFAPS